MYKFIVLILLIGVSFSKQEATTSKGKKVFLFDDGTWKYAKDVINKDDFKIQIRKIHSINHWYGMTINNECIIFKFKFRGIIFFCKSIFISSWR